jgi:hypothetical protein
MRAFGITYCTDALLSTHGAELVEIMGDFRAHTLFEPALTVVTYDGSAAQSELEVMRQCKALLSCYGAMDFFLASCKHVRTNLGAERHNAGELAAPRVHEPACPSTSEPIRAGACSANLDAEAPAPS